MKIIIKKSPHSGSIVPEWGLYKNGGYYGIMKIIIKKSPHSGSIVPEWGLRNNNGHYGIGIMKIIIGTIKKSPHSGSIVPEWGLFFLQNSIIQNQRTLR